MRCTSACSRPRCIMPSCLSPAVSLKYRSAYIPRHGEHSSPKLGMVGLTLPGARPRPSQCFPEGSRILSKISYPNAADGFFPMILPSLHSNRPNWSRTARIFGARLVAKRLECVELAPAFDDPSPSTAGASSTHSPAVRDSARFGCGFAVLHSLQSSFLHANSLFRALRSLGSLAL